MNKINFNHITRSINKLYNEMDNVGAIPQSAGISPGVDNGQNQLIVFPSSEPVKVDKIKSTPDNVLKDVCNKIEEKIITIKSKLNIDKNIIKQLEQINKHLENLI